MSFGAITPDGRPNNLGEVLPDGTKNNITVTTSLQSFGLIVTAEPYFSVSQPSDVVVMENQIIQDRTTGVLEKVNAHYSLLPRGAYAENGRRQEQHEPDHAQREVPRLSCTKHSMPCASLRPLEQINTLRTSWRRPIRT